MRVKAYVNLLGKVAKPWKDRDGIDRVSYSANVMQENGEVIDTIRLTRQKVLIGGNSFRNQGVGGRNDKFCNYFTTFQKRG